MAKLHWAFIYFAPESNSETDRIVIDRGDQRAVLVPVPRIEDAPVLAQELVSAGARLIELCGVFGTSGTVAVRNAVGEDVPIGAVSFDADSAVGLGHLLRED